MAATQFTASRTGNVFTTPTHVMRAVMRTLAVDPVACQYGNINRSLSTEFIKNGTKMGRTIYTRLARYHEVHDGPDMQTPALGSNIGDLDEQTVAVNLNRQKYTAFEWESFNEVRYVQDVYEREVADAVKGLVNVLDMDAVKYIGDTIARFEPGAGIGTLPGAGDTSDTASGYRVYAKAADRLMEMGVPTPYRAIVPQRASTDLVIESRELFNPGGEISRQFRTGQFGGGMGGATIAGISYWFSTGNPYMNDVPSGLTQGATVGNAMGAQTNGTTLMLDGFANNARVFNRGNSLRFATGANVYETNPQPPHNTFGSQADFVVTKDVQSSASGVASVPIWPPIAAGSVPGRNVSSQIADNSRLELYGTADTAFSSIANRRFMFGLVFNADQGVLVMADLPLARGLDVAQRTRSRKAGVAARYIRAYNINNDRKVSRLDIAYGGGEVGNGRSMGVKIPGGPASTIPTN